MNYRSPDYGGHGGVATMEGSVSDLDALIKRADQRFYAKKTVDAIVSNPGHGHPIGRKRLGEDKAC
jgi:hypothetical protein